MSQDPLIRSIDPATMRLQLGRRGLVTVAEHVVWQEARSRLDDRFSFIRCAQEPRLDHGIADYGKALHIDPASMQLVWSVGLLAYLADMRSTLAFWSRSLAPGGLAMFATLGPDSFRSLAVALGDDAQERHVQGYPDMHDIGDALMACGMLDPVMDAEWITLTYSDPAAALADLRALGGNALAARARTLCAPAWRNRVLEAIESLRSDGRIRLQVELVFGHAWRADPAARGKASLASEPQPIRFVGRGTKGPGGGL